MRGLELHGRPRRCCCWSVIRVGKARLYVIKTLHEIGIWGDFVSRFSYFVFRISF